MSLPRPRPELARLDRRSATASTSSAPVTLRPVEGRFTFDPDELLATVDEKAAAKPAKDAAPEPGKEASENSESAPANEREVEINVPALGESVTEATVATWYKAVGDSVAQDEMLCELETDKVTLEFNAPASGTLAEILVEEGGDVEVGALAVPRRDDPVDLVLRGEGVVG